jgi:hypothetical protein
VRLASFNRFRLRSPAQRAVACAVVAAFAALLSLTSVSLFPPGLKHRRLAIAAASTHVLVDLPQSVVRDRSLAGSEFDALSARAILLGKVMTSDPVRVGIAQRAGIDPDRLGIIQQRLDKVPVALNEPDNERRAEGILSSAQPFRLLVQPDDALPVLNIYTQAPDPQQAQRLADAVAPALADYLRSLALKAGTNPADQVHLKQLGEARAGTVNGGAAAMIAGLTFLVTFGILYGLLAIAAHARRRHDAPAPAPAPEQDEEPAPAPRAPVRLRWPAPEAGRALTPRLLPVALVPSTAEGAVLPAPALLRRIDTRPQLRTVATAMGDWPRTTRVMPWLLAVFMAVVWLVPFNVIQLTVSTPIDMKFDRIVLGPILVVWVVCIIVGGVGAPRIRVTPVHVALMTLGAFIGLSLVLNATRLNHALELDTSVKKLALLASYIALFLVAASSIRRSEIRPFLTYTLVLSVLCAIGTIWEYRFQYNIFYAFSDKLLPGIFTVGAAESSAVDDIGRRIVRGPGEVPLEAVAMMSMALPIALTGFIRAGATTRQRVLYGLAACLLVAAVVSTYRKSAFIAPISVVLTLAYFRRRELLRLAPLGLVLLVAVHVLSPGAFGSIASQLHANRLGAVATVSDRTSDYDAIRPDVWSHLAFGRGFAAYDHNSYRILDNELLGRLVEVGVLGLLAYVGMILAVVGTALPSIRARGPDAGLGLTVAAVAICMLSVSALFDVMSFPHCPYIFLWMSALLAVSVSAPPRADDDKEPAWSS